MFVSARKIVNEAMDDYGLTGQTHFKRFYKWLRTAIMDLGAIPEYNLKSVTLEIDKECNGMTLPDDLVSLRRVFLCDYSGKLTEAGYGGIQPSNLWDPDGDCTFYRNGKSPVNLGYSGEGSYSSAYGNGYAYSNHLLPSLHQGYDVVLGQQDEKLFFMAGDINRYKLAIVEYNGFRMDSDGLIKVPQDAELAVNSFMQYSQTRRERRKDRAKVPQSEVQFDRQVWIEEFRRSYTQLKMPSKIFMDEWVLDNWGMRLPVPRKRMSGRVNVASTPEVSRMTQKDPLEDMIDSISVEPIFIDPSVDPCIVGAPSCPGIGDMEINDSFIVGPCGTEVEPEPECDGVCLVDCVAYEDSDYRYVSCLEDPGTDSTKWVVNRYTKTSPVVKTQATPLNNPLQFAKPTSLFLVQPLNYDPV
ncbi:MAG: hypothetical protein ACQ5SW_00065 [Sphaerochaetaceae bacterium]